MIRLALFGLMVLGVVLPGGCIDLDINTPDSLLPIGSAFVLTGTADVIDQDGPCLVWIGENGIYYHLFQSTTLDNETFDQVTTPGVTSRLELSERTDLDVACQVGVIVQVVDVLEIVE